MADKYYRTRPQVMAAIQYDPNDKQALVDFVNDLDAVTPGERVASVWVEELDTDIQVDPGDFVTRNHKGWFNVFGPEEFHLNFEAIDNVGC